MKFRLPPPQDRGAIKRDMALLVSAFIAIVLLALLSQTSLTLRKNTTLDEENLARVTFVFSPEKTRRFSGEITPGTTIADVLEIASATGQFPLTMTEGGQPVSVDGIETSWEIYQNGRLIAQPTTGTLVASGDEIHVVAQ